MKTANGLIALFVVFFFWSIVCASLWVFDIPDLARGVGTSGCIIGFALTMIKVIEFLAAVPREGDTAGGRSCVVRASSPQPPGTYEEVADLNHWRGYLSEKETGILKSHPDSPFAAHLDEPTYARSHRDAALLLDEIRGAEETAKELENLGIPTHYEFPPFRKDGEDVR